MKYAHLEEKTNKILGWYDSDIHSGIPTPNIEVTDDVWQKAINTNANCYENKKFIAKDFRTDEDLLQEKINEAKLYLTKTNHKFYIGYIPKENEDLELIKAKRDEALLFIRANS